MKIIKGNPLPLGAAASGKTANFAVAVPKEKACKLLLYRKGSNRTAHSFEMKERVGDICFIGIEGEHLSEYEYNYQVDGETILDPYSRGISGIKKWGLFDGKGSDQVKCRIFEACDRWTEEERGPIHLPYSETVAYAIHVRGFTKDSSSKAANKGTFQGVVDKIPYLKELGINQLHCMPVYEFPEKGEYVNYWGYGEGFYFAPKSSYSADGDGRGGLRSMVRACHEAEIEVILEMPFAEGCTCQQMTDCLRYYVLSYHVDGFILNPLVSPVEMLRQDPLLKQTKILTHQNAFLNTMRRFLKGDEGMVEDVMHHLRHHSEREQIFNSITENTGFTLKDLVSFENKHNEANGENNQDGPDCNYSWNCGAEGTTRKKSIQNLRLHQMRNAMILLLLAQGTPCILGGDEMENSQKGNNNVYCQDNPTGWINWPKKESEVAFAGFVKDLIDFRKKHPVFCPEEEMSGIDRRGRGIPDISYHGEEAWRPDMGMSSRQLGVFYSGEDLHEPCFVAYNMHWLAHDFALPGIGKEKRWFAAVTTEEGVLEQPACIKDQKHITVAPRTILVLVGRPCGGKNEFIHA